jgi:hypothetical protein
VLKPSAVKRNGAERQGSLSRQFVFDLAAKRHGIAIKASRSVIGPKERLCRLCINQHNVKRLGGISSCSRCNRIEVATSGLVSPGGLSIEQTS